MFCANTQCFNNYQTKIKLSKLKLKVKNENKTSLIPAFPLIFEDQYLDKVFKLELYSALKNTMNKIKISILGGKYSNISFNF